MSNIDFTPEQKQQHEKHKQLQQEFARLFSLKSEMKANEEPLLIALYTELIGTKKFELYCLSIDIVIAKRRIEYLQAFINKNEAANLVEIEKKIKQDFAEYKAKIEEETKRIAAAKQLLNSPFLSEEETKQLKETYRSIVKRLHPDINPNISDYEKDLFIKAQIAYEMGNLIELKKIFLALNIDEKQTQISDINLQDRIADLENKINTLNNQIEELNTLFPFNIKEKIKSDEWVKHEQLKVEQLIEKSKVELEKFKTYITLLEEWKPK